jgi:hypothetical protein
LVAAHFGGRHKSVIKDVITLSPCLLCVEDLDSLAEALSFGWIISPPAPIPAV